MSKADPAMLKAISNIWTTVPCKKSESKAADSPDKRHRRLWNQLDERLLREVFNQQPILPIQTTDRIGKTQLEGKSHDDLEFSLFFGSGVTANPPPFPLVKTYQIKINSARMKISASEFLEIFGINDVDLTECLRNDNAVNRLDLQNKLDAKINASNNTLKIGRTTGKYLDENYLNQNNLINTDGTSQISPRYAFFHSVGRPRCRFDGEFRKLKTIVRNNLNRPGIPLIPDDRIDLSVRYSFARKATGNYKGNIEFSVEVGDLVDFAIDHGQSVSYKKETFIVNVHLDVEETVGDNKNWQERVEGLLKDKNANLLAAMN